jgi:hypothetical protein
MAEGEWGEREREELWSGDCWRSEECGELKRGRWRRSNGRPEGGELAVPVSETCFFSEGNSCSETELESDQ